MNPSHQDNQRTATRAAVGNDEKFLTFCLGHEEYGFPILVVREIIGVIDITPVPTMPEYVKGVMNLRGRIIPVVELRSKFRMPGVEYTAETCIIVVEVSNPAGGVYQIGAVVDNVREVIDIPRQNIQPPAALGAAIPLNFILGLGKVKGKVVILLDINSVGMLGDPALQQAATNVETTMARAA